MDIVSNQSIIEDYFTLKNKVNDLESKNQELEQKIQKLEYVIINRNKTTFSKKLFSYYEKMKIISVVFIFFFGNKILTNPLFFTCIKLITKLVF